MAFRQDGFDSYFPLKYFLGSPNNLTSFACTLYLGPCEVQDLLLTSHCVSFLDNHFHKSRPINTFKQAAIRLLFTYLLDLKLNKESLLRISTTWDLSISKRTWIIVQCTLFPINFSQSTHYSLLYNLSQIPKHNTNPADVNGNR